MSNYIVIGFIVCSILYPFETKHYTAKAVDTIHDFVKKS